MQKWTAALPLFLSVMAGRAQIDRADTILVNGRIITMDAADSISEAVAISNGKILEVGAKPAVMRHADGSTTIIDLHGRTATPGLIDSHLHFASVEPIYSIDLGTVHNIDEVLDKVRERVAKARPGEWVRGQGWDEGKLAERRYIFASDLDKVAPNNPVWLTHTPGHYGVGQ